MLLDRKPLKPHSLQQIILNHRETKTENKVFLRHSLSVSYPLSTLSTGRLNHSKTDQSKSYCAVTRAYFSAYYSMIWQSFK